MGSDRELARSEGTGLAALLMVADGRFPSGGYAHSGGLESAVRRGWVRTAEDLEQFLLGRVSTVGLVSACFAVAAHRSPYPAALLALDAELVARTPSAALRQVGVDLGRMLLRSARSTCPHPVLDSAPERLQQPLVYGLLARALGTSARAAAAAVLHETIAGPASAAVKVMHIDPFTAQRALLGLSGRLDGLAEHAVALGQGSAEGLPGLSSPLSDIAAEHHRRDSVRLFAS